MLSSDCEVQLLDEARGLQINTPLILNNVILKADYLKNTNFILFYFYSQEKFR